MAGDARGRLGRRALLVRGGRWAALLSLPALPLLPACDRDGGGDATRATGPQSQPQPGTGTGTGREVPSEAKPAPRFFTASEFAIVGAAVARLLPAADAAGPPGQPSPAIGLPGADRAGVAGFVDAQLASPSFAGLQRMMQAGVGFLDRTARRDHGGAFVALAPPAQDAVLAAFQTGAVGGLRFPQARFFDQLLTFALEGYLGAPRHGGNRDAMVWRALGIDPRCHNMYQC